MNTRFFTAIVLFSCFIAASSCLKEKDIEPSVYKLPMPAGTVNIEGKVWTSVQPAYATPRHLKALAPFDDRMLYFYNGSGSYSYGYYTENGFYGSVVGNFGLNKIQEVDDTLYGLPEYGSYGVYRYIYTGVQYMWDAIPMATGPTKAVAKHDGLLVISCANAPYVRIRNGATYIQLGEPCGDLVYDLATYDGKLIAAGKFTSIGAGTFNHIAQWNGSVWEPLATGLDGEIFDLEIYCGKLIAVGNFESNGDGDENCRYVAQWDGISWKPLGTGLVGPYGSGIKALAYGSQLFIGGRFIGSDGVTSANVIKWDGTSFISLAGGVPDPVGPICIYKNKLYVANAFPIIQGNFLLRLDHY